MNEGSIYLKDLNSKFGTLALLQEDFECTYQKISLQIGRSYFETKLINYTEYLSFKEEEQKKKK